MERIEKITRVLTMPPLVTGLTVLLLYEVQALNMMEFIMAEGCLLFFPALAYPFREIFHIGKDRRSGQRTTAMIFSCFSYSYGFIWSLTSNAGMVCKVLFTSYILSVIALLIANKLCHFKASGHACSTTAPMVLLSWQVSPYLVLPSLGLVLAVYYSSIKLKQHTLGQLIAGSAFSILAGLISILLFNN
ncbi:hypothetical protein SDC9_144637 [bioreactor metagenome]|uniref:Phosphatidic acid phosphatase type 2/haloperoxidase domain-containing protein n=1 Tax=bioreactor metagenome TaxID=1076179 RepID=A0A645E6L3_9ZZZZ|nr:hypothetical protein [Erysipelotrichaceae bacterium]